MVPAEQLISPKLDVVLLVTTVDHIAATLGTDMYKNILHATDLNETHYKTCEQAKKIASHCHATLSLIHVIEAPATLQIAQGIGFAEIGMPVKDDAEVVMRLLGEALHIPPQHLYVEVGSVKERVLEKIKTLNCDLLIISRHASYHLLSFLEQHEHALLNNVPCDVLCLR